MENKTYVDEAYKIDIGKIHPFVHNCSRKTKRSIDMIKNSLVANGQIAPIIVNHPDHVYNGTRIICKGHGVFYAAQELGWKEVKILEIPFRDTEHFIRYNIEDNSSAQFFEWDHDILANTVSLIDIDPVDLGIQLNIEGPKPSGNEGPEEIELCPTCGKKA